MLNPSIIQRCLATADFRTPILIHVLDSVDSTNRFIKDLPVTDVLEICCAEEQTQGRGRFGRSWHSPFGENIYFSMRWRFDCNISQLSGLSLVVSMAVLAALKNINNDICVKWPNDLLWHDKKLSGSLIEVIGSSDVVIGIGLNVNSNPNDQTVLDRPCSSLCEIAGKNFDRNSLIAQVIIQLDQHLKQFIKHGFFSFIPTWQKTDHLHGKSITVSQPTGRLSGVANGVNEAGQLILIDDMGVTHYLSAGETSLRV